MGDSWDDCASTWDEDPTVREYSNKAFESLIAQVPLNNALRILDFGCGTGLLTEKLRTTLPSCHIVALDVSRKMIEVKNLLCV